TAEADALADRTHAMEMDLHHCLIHNDDRSPPVGVTSVEITTENHWDSKCFEKLRADHVQVDLTRISGPNATAFGGHEIILVFRSALDHEPANPALARHDRLARQAHHLDAREALNTFEELLVELATLFTCVP